MSTNCNVCIGGFDGDAAEFFHTETIKARKPHKCSECGEDIIKGQSYQRCIGKNDGDFWSFKTCLMCAEIRKVFSCNEPEELGGTLWEQMQDYAFPSLTTASPCFRELSPAAKQFVLDRWKEWKLA